MGILPDHDPTNGGYGYKSADDAFSTFDPDNLPLGETFKINGAIYELIKDEEGLKFIKQEE